jgi:hypothetical protein
MPFANSGGTGLVGTFAYKSVSGLVSVPVLLQAKSESAIKLQKMNVIFFMTNKFYACKATTERKAFFQQQNGFTELRSSTYEKEFQQNNIAAMHQEERPVCWDQTSPP